MVAQNFKEVDNESDVGEGRKWGGLDKPALREGQGGGRSWVRGVGSHEAGACPPQPGRGCSQPPCPQRLLPRWGDQTARGAAVSLAVGTDVNSTSILSLSAPWTSLWWQCKPTFDNPNIGNSHFEHFQEKLGEKVVPELGLQERVCWGPNVYSLSGPPTPWYKKMQLYFSILLSTLQMPEDVVLLSGVILIIEDVSVEFHSHPTLLPLRPPYPEQHPCSTSVHTGPAER